MPLNVEHLIMSNTETQYWYWKFHIDLNQNTCRVRIKTSTKIYLYEIILLNYKYIESFCNIHIHVLKSNIFIKITWLKYGNYILSGIVHWSIPFADQLFYLYEMIEQCVCVNMAAYFSILIPNLAAINKLKCHTEKNQWNMSHESQCRNQYYFGLHDIHVQQNQYLLLEPFSFLYDAKKKQI